MTATAQGPQPRARSSHAAAGSAERPRVLIVGAGFAGAAAFKALRASDVDVTVIDRRNHHLFQPLLYQVATAALSPADIAAPIRAMARGHDNIEVLLDEVIGVDTSARLVRTRGGAAHRYDYLVLATGSEFSYFGHEDWPRFAPGLKSVEDAVEVRRRILVAFECAEATSDPEAQRRLLTFVLVGGGPTGVEMAGALAELTRATLARDFRNIRPAAARILLIEAGPRLLNGFPERLGAYALEALRRMEVEVRLNSPIEAIDAESARVAGEKISASTVIWCAGVKSTPVGEWLGVETERNGGIRVTPDLSLPGHPEVFVLGDAAVVAEGPDERPLPWLAAVAAQQGKYVGKLIASRVAGRTNTQPFRYRNLGTMATIGRSAAVADFGRVKLTGRIAWLLWGFVHIYLLIGFRNRLSVFVNWMWSWITYGRGARLITGPIEAPPGLQSKGDDTAAAPPAPGRSTAH